MFAYRFFQTKPVAFRIPICRQTPAIGPTRVALSQVVRRACSQLYEVETIQVHDLCPG